MWSKKNLEARILYTLKKIVRYLLPKRHSKKASLSRNTFLMKKWQDVSLPKGCIHVFLRHVKRLCHLFYFVLSPYSKVFSYKGKNAIF